jgi:hypothetical protein
MRSLLGKLTKRVSVATDTRATTEERLEAAFSVQFVLRPHGEDLWEKLASHGHEL